MINKELLLEAYEWFCYYVAKEQGFPFTSFSNGVMFEQEGYKEDVYEKVQDILSVEKWEENDVGRGTISDCVIGAINASENLIDYRNKDDFNDTVIRNKEEFDDIFFELYRKDNPSKAFERVCECWARRYDVLSYLMFIKNKDKYIDCRGSNHKRIFELLGLSTDCFKKCSWENYNLYLSTMYEIREFLEEQFGMHISLLEAHSFIWKVKSGKTDYEKNIIRIREAKKDDAMVKKVASGKIDLSERVKETPPQPKVASHNRTDTTKKSYYRNEKEIKEALQRADYKCELDFDGSHKTFIRKRDGRQYMEPHHLIPMCYQERFGNNSLHNWTNIVSLCSNCHNHIHYGEGSEVLITKLYKGRKELLEKSGIGVSLEELLKMYE